jgi:hypothetical protein
VHVELALDARRDGGEDDTSLTLEALGASIDKGLDSVGVFSSLLGDGDKHSIDPSAGFDAVQAADNDLELLVELLVKVLNAVVVCGYGHALDAFLHEFGGDFGLVFPYIVFAEEELAVEVGDVDGVWECGERMVMVRARAWK